MILVIVGTASRPFDRLLDEMERVSTSLDEVVVVQSGASAKKYQNMVCQQYFSEKEMMDNYDNASLIICHAGVGTIKNGLTRNIPLVLVPRKADLGEVDTDHQMMIARKVESMGRGVIVEDISDLHSAIDCARHLMFPPYEENTELCEFLSELLSEIDMARRNKP